jgi:hypothetical protein
MSKLSEAEAIYKLRGKKIRDIFAGLGDEIVLEFEDGTCADISSTYFPDGTINNIIIDVREGK